MATLHPRELRIGRLFDDVRDAVIGIAAEQGRVVLWNPAAQRLFGYAAAEMLGQPIERVLPGPLPLDADARTSLQVTARHKDGRALPVALALSPLDDTAEASRVLLAVVHDALARDAPGREPEQAARQHAQLLTWAADGIVGLDRDGRVSFCNPAASRLLGYAPRELLGRPTDDTFHQHQANGSPCLDCTCPLSAPLRDGFMCGPSRDVLRRQDGSSVAVEILSAPIWEAGAIAGAVVTFRAARQRPRASEVRSAVERQAALRGDVGIALNTPGTLRETLQRCASALVRHLDAAFARIWILDAAHDVLQLEASAGLYTRLDGTHARVPVGHLKIGLVAAERQPHFTNDVLHDPWVADKAWAAREGMVAFAGCPLLIDGRLVGVMALFARHALPDDTLDTLAAVALVTAQAVERKRAEELLAQRAEELARSNADLEQFAYVASHDLQEPLRVIVSYLQLFERRYAGQIDERADKYIHYAVDGAKRMQRLINDLLAYSRIGRGGQQQARLDAGLALERALGALDAAIRECGATVTSDPLPTVAGSLTELTQLFQNLIGNAIKFRGAAPPRIHVSAVAEGAEWRFSVQDNGIGIEPEFQERIFTMFQRLHSRADYPGTGIGLAICRKVVEHHGGRIWVESRLGEGATFVFTLPRGPRGAS